jgi:hypothetical protein
MPYFFYYSLFGGDVTTQTFEDLLNPTFGPQQSTVRIMCTTNILRQFLSAQPPLEVNSVFHFCLEKKRIRKLIVITFARLFAVHMSVFEEKFFL